MRTAHIKRKTNETEIGLSINLDGCGEYSLDTSIPFLDHMISQIAKHGLFDITIKTRGDLEVDFHHTVEDVGIVFGEAVLTALGDKKGIRRFGDAVVPLDDALVSTVIDISGRPFFVYNVTIFKGKVGNFDTELLEGFFHGVSNHMKATIHINLLYGTNLHHIAEAMFKSFARAIYLATSIDKRIKGIPSTKGRL